MRKILKAILAGALLLFLPAFAFAAFDDVTLTTDTVLTVNGITVNVSGTNAAVESIVVNSANFVVTLAAGSSFEVTAPNRNVFSVDTMTGQVANVCTSSESKVGYSVTSALTVTVTPQASLCSSASGSGGSSSGGGSSSTAAAPAVPATPATTTPATTTPATPATPAAPVGGLTEGQVQSILTLLESFGADQTVIDKVNAALHGQAAAGSSSAPAAFSRDLKTGMTGDDVKTLQVFLNTHGYPLTSSGLGSPGNETDFFGALTRAALAKFQAANGISPPAGYFGPKTRAFIAGI